MHLGDENMCIQLKPLTINDINIYQRYYQVANYEGYQTNIYSLLLWNNAYQTQFYYNDHYLVTLCQYNQRYFWNVPLTTKEYFKEAIDDILEYCEKHQIPFLMDGILSLQEEWLNELYTNQFTFKHSLDQQSYIYDAHVNRTLSGKKMQKRRNHFNAFIKEYNHRFIYRSITKEDYDDIIALYDRWALGKQSQHLNFERKGIIDILKHIDDLDYQMACIEIDGKIEAFIIGSKLNHQTVQIHVEKANKDIRGLYVAIFKFFLENEYKDILWVNREEDMGIESLRKAKQQLHPAYLLDQSFAYLNTPIVITKAKYEDMLVLKKMWLSTFDEDDEVFYDDYIQKSNLNIYVLKMNYHIVSVIYLRKLEENRNIYYIEGVMTDIYFQHQGLMKQLMHYVLNIHKDDILFIQAYNWDVYKSFPFNYSYNKKISTINSLMPIEECIEIKCGIHLALFKDLYNQYASQYKNYIKRNTWIDIERANALYNDNGYLLYSQFNDVYVVTEIVYKNIEVAYQLLNELYKKVGAFKIISDESFGNDETITFVKSTHDFEDLYFNEYI